MILTVHDQIVLQGPAERAKLQPFVEAVKVVMTTPPPWASVPILTDCKIGPNFNEDEMESPAKLWPPRKFPALRCLLLALLGVALIAIMVFWFNF